MNIAEMTIHISQDLQPMHKERLEEEVRVLEGVTGASFNIRIKHWLSVVYDSESITAKMILNLVRQWDKNAVFVSY